MRKSLSVAGIALSAMLCLVGSLPGQVPCEDEWKVGRLGLTQTTTEDGPIYQTYIPIGQGSDVDICEALPFEKGCPTYLCATTGTGTSCAAALVQQCHLYRVRTCVYEVPTVRELIPLDISQCL